MKMHLWSLFFGVFFVLIGINIILKTFFHFDIPFFRIAFALLVIAVGVSIMFPGTFGKCCPPNSVIDEKTTMFGEQNIGGDKIPGEHSVVFGSLNLDLTKVDISKETVKVKVDAVFAGAEIRIDATKPVRIVGSSAFGGIVMPNGNTAAFGTSIYQSDSYKEGQPYLNIDVNAVFGGVEIKR